MKQFLFFTGIGAIGTAVHYIILVLLVQCFSWTPVVSTTLGFCGGALTNYVLNYRFTFRSDKKHLTTLPKFIIIASIGAVLNSTIMVLGLQQLDSHYLLIQVGATAITLLWNFSANKFWTFA